MAANQPELFRILIVTADKGTTHSAFEDLFDNENFDEETFTFNFTAENKEVLVRGAWPDSDFKISESFDALVMIVEYGDEIAQVAGFSRQFFANSVHKVLVCDKIKQSAIAADIGATIFSENVKNEVFPFLLNLDRQLDEAIQRVFISFDKDSSGYIDINKLYAVGSELGIMLSQDDIQNIMTDIDQDQDNKISLQEFRQWWKSGRKGTAVIFKKMTGLQAKFQGLLENANLELVQQLTDSDDRTNTYGLTVNVGDPNQTHWKNQVNLQFKTGRVEEIDEIFEIHGIQKTPSNLNFGVSIKLQNGVDSDTLVDRVNSIIGTLTNLYSSRSRTFTEVLTFTDISARVVDGRLSIFVSINFPQKDANAFDNRTWNGWFRHFLSEEHPISLELDIKTDNDLSALIQGNEINLNTIYGSSQYKFTANIWSGLLNWALEAGGAYANHSKGRILILLGFLEQGNLTLNLKSTLDLPDELKSIIQQVLIPRISAIKNQIPPFTQKAFQKAPFLNDLLPLFKNDLDLTDVFGVVTMRTVNVIARSKSEDVHFLYESLLDIAGLAHLDKLDRLI